MFTNLVGTYTDAYQGDEEPFTLVISGAGRPVRGFPRGLDVMALLGSNRSREMLVQNPPQRPEWVSNFMG